MKEFKPMKELIGALYEIRNAIKGEGDNNNNENKNNGLFGADAIIYPETHLEQETQISASDYKIFYDFDEFFNYFKTQAPYDNTVPIIFAYKSNDIDIIGKPYAGQLTSNSVKISFVLEDSSENFTILDLGQLADNLNGFYAIS